MEIEWIELEKLIPYVNNPKEHPEEQVKKIASSIKNFGFRVPILIDEKNEIIAGHGRYLAAKLLGLEKVPVIRVTDLTEAQKKAFRIADNKVAESGWDTELLALEVEALKEMDINLEVLGFDEVELAELLDMELEEKDLSVLEDNEPIAEDIKKVVLVFSPEEYEEYTSLIDALPAADRIEDIILEALRCLAGGKN